MRKRLFGILASVAVIVAACGGATTSTAPAVSTAPGASTAPVASTPPASDLAAEQVLRIDLGNEPPSLDPTLATDSVSIQVLKAITRPLVYFDKDGKIIPSLAEKWVVSADAKTITFTLKDAKYSNGDQIVAADLVYSWKRLMDPRVASDYAYVTEEIAGAPELLALAGKKPPATDAEVDALLATAGVSAPDPKTFIVILQKPATYFLSVAALWQFSPIQEKWITSPNATEAANYVSSGPFMMESWKHESEIVLVPNPNWYGETKPTLTKIIMSMTKEPAQAQAAFENGELDMVRPPGAEIARVRDDPVLGKNVIIAPYFRTYYYNYDTTKGPTANKDFRIALTQAIDKQALIDATLSGVGQVASSQIMPGIPGHQKDLDPYPYDVTAAKASMAKALTALGVASAADLGPLKFGYNTGSDHELSVAFMAEAWRTTFGLETEQVGSEWSVFLNQRHDLQFAISRSGWGADYAHANNQLAGLFTCGGGNNDSGYCNKDFDDLLAKAAVEPDQEKQVALYEQAQTILVNDQPVVFLRFYVNAYEVAPYVGGIQSLGSDSELPGDQFFETIFIKKQ